MIVALPNPALTPISTVGASMWADSCTAYVKNSYSPESPESII